MKLALYNYDDIERFERLAEDAAGASCEGAEHGHGDKSERVMDETEIPKGTKCQGGSKFRPCKNPAKHMVVQRTYSGEPLLDGVPRPMCGVHRNENERARQRGEQHAMHRAADKERQKRVGYATNVAMMLAQAIAAQSNLIGVSFEVSHDGYTLRMDVESGEKLLRWLT